MKPPPAPPDDEVLVGRTGSFVEICIGAAVVRMTPMEAEGIVYAIEQTIRQIEQPRTKERVH